MSGFRAETPGLRRELVLGVGGSMVVWPKVNGVNVVVTEATASQGVATVTTPVDLGYSYVTVTFGAGEVPGLGDAANPQRTTDLPLTVGWTGPAGAGFEVVVYDVVRVPFPPAVGLNLLRVQRPAIREVLARLGEELAYPDTPLDPETVAGIYAAEARVELQDRLRAAAIEAQTSRPALYLDRDRLTRAEVALTLAHIYEAIAKNPRGVGLAGSSIDDDSAQAQAWRTRYDEAFAGLGPLAADLDGDGTKDADLARPTIGVIVTRRI